MLSHGQHVGGASPHLSLFCNVASKEGNEPGVPELSSARCFMRARQRDEGRFLPNKANGRNASSLNELSVMAASHRVFPSIIAVIPCYLPVILGRDPGFAGTSSGLALLISCFNREHKPPTKGHHPRA